MTYSASEMQEVNGALYEGLASDEPWRSALESLRQVLGASRTELLSERQCDFVVAVGPNVKSDMGHGSRWVLPTNNAIDAIQTAAIRGLARCPASVVNADDVESPWRIAHHFRDLSNRYSLLAARTRDLPPFTENETEQLGDFGCHLSRAMRLRREFLRCRLTNAFQGEGLDRLGIAGLLADRAGETTLLNNLAHRLVTERDGLELRAGRVHAVLEPDNRRLQGAISDVMSSDEANPLTRALAISRRSGKRDFGLVVSGRRAISIGSGRPEVNALIFVRDSDADMEIDAGTIQQLFGFTRAEAKLAAGLAKGLCLNDLEGMLNIRHNTARAHLRAMFLKVDVKRQGELIHLLANCVAPLGSGPAGTTRDCFLPTS